VRAGDDVPIFGKNAWDWKLGVLLTSSMI
jgi:hypothetical protein